MKQVEIIKSIVLFLLIALSLILNFFDMDIYAKLYQQLIKNQLLIFLFPIETTH